MGETTGISWCDHTFNPWIGCTKVSPACDHCYAETYGHRFGVEWGGERRRTSKSNWQQPLRWDRAAEKAGERRRVFCASLADVFDNQVSIHWMDDLWTLISVTPHLDWLLLTKRPQNIRHRLPTGWTPDGGAWPNVWLGTTTENQPEFDRRWPYLSAIPAQVHFISYEPALGPLTLKDSYPVPDWVIAGGESGARARPAHPQWFRDLRDECANARIAFHFKQWGEWAQAGETHMDRVGKKRAGRLLDGVEHNGSLTA